MEKKLFFASAVLIVIALVFGVLFWVYRPATDKENININDPSILDSDHDGLTNAQEAELGTDQNNADSDGDGLKDNIEVQTYHTNPLSQDTDKDGYSDYTEIQHGFNPLGK